MMLSWKTSRRLDQIAQRWAQLAEQRRVAFTELYESGNWKKYYTKDEIRLRIWEVAKDAERWSEIAASSPNEPGAPAAAGADPKARHRTAA
jgi:hypothetical protein